MLFSLSGAVFLLSSSQDIPKNAAPNVLFTFRGCVSCLYHMCLPCSLEILTLSVTQELWNMITAQMLDPYACLHECGDLTLGRSYIRHEVVFIPRACRSYPKAKRVKEQVPFAFCERACESCAVAWKSRREFAGTGCMICVAWPVRV